MSTYHFIVCEDCKEKTDAASRTSGGYCHLADSSHTLIPFIIAHSGHNVKIVNEHREEFYDEEYEEWTEENCKEMIRRAQEDRENSWQ